jgi:hypothetical protein
LIFDPKTVNLSQVPFQVSREQVRKEKNNMSLKTEGMSKRGLASATIEVRERVARAGGNAPHTKRGLQAASPEVREAIARKGGLARGEQRRSKNAEDSARVPVRVA